MQQKRKLSPHEIEFIFSDFDLFFPRYLNEEMKSVIINHNKQILLNQFEQFTIYPDRIPELKKKVEMYIKRSIIPTGEMVGVICAQSIGERQTQLTLNSFHQAGLTVNTVITGVPRFLEILNATKEPKVASNSFQLLNKSHETIQQVKQEIGNHLRYLTWKDVIVEETFHLVKDDEPWYESFEYFYSNQFRQHKTCFSYQIDRQKFFTNQLSFHNIREKIESEFEYVYVVFSPLYIGQVDVFIDTTDIIENNNNIPSSKKEFFLKLFFEDSVRPKIADIPISGVPKIIDYHISRKNDIFQIDTEGSNFMDILKLPFVDTSTLRTNHMWEIYEILGIESTRKFLMEELKNIVSSDGTFINECHLTILVDLMTYNGCIQSISRYGVKKDQNSVLTRSSFEESLEHFSKAGFFSEKEKIDSVSASIMCGKRSRIGTGIMETMVDWEKL